MITGIVPHLPGAIRTTVPDQDNLPKGTIPVLVLIALINTEVPFRHLPTLLLQTIAAAPPFPWW